MGLLIQSVAKSITWASCLNLHLIFRSPYQLDKWQFSGFIRRQSYNFSSSSYLQALYNALIYSVLEYGAIVWSSYTTADIPQIDLLQNFLWAFTGYGSKIPHPEHDYRSISQALKFASFADRRNKFVINLICGLIDVQVDGLRLLEQLNFHIPSNSGFHNTFYLLNNKTNFSTNASLPKIMCNVNIFKNVQYRGTHSTLILPTTNCMLYFYY